MKPAPRLLVTRFAPHAQELVERLSHVDCFAIAQPLLMTTLLKERQALDIFLSGYYDLVIVVSGNAVKYAQQQISGDWPRATYLAVGKSTQIQLSEVTKQDVMCPLTRFDSEGLLELAVLQSIKNKHVLILRGEGGRDLLENALIERGAKVDFLQTYKRVKIVLDGHELANNWQQASINGVIISSVEILNQLFALVPMNHKDWLLGLVFYVPSQRVAEEATLLGAKDVVLLPSLRTEQLVEFFKADDGNCIAR